MVMRVMLIGLLVIGAVTMLEPDVSAHPRPCGGDTCCFSAKEWEEACKQVKQDKEIGQVWLIGKTMAARDKARKELIECGVDPEMIGELVYKDRAYEGLGWINLAGGKIEVLMLDPKRIEELMNEGPEPTVIVNKRTRK
jgi:hypothetical protein